MKIAAYINPTDYATIFALKRKMPWLLFKDTIAGAVTTFRSKRPR
jgi:hypothetical protein